MKGQEVIIKMRTVQKVKPVAVYVHDYPCRAGFIDNHSPDICIYGDHLETLDWRFVIGLDVRVTASTEDRARKLFDAIQAAGAAKISVCHIGDEGYYDDSYMQVWEKEKGMIYG